MDTSENFFSGFLDNSYTIDCLFNTLNISSQTNPVNLENKSDKESGIN